MAVHSGFIHYYDLLGLDRDAYRVHYRFENSGSLVVQNEAPDFPMLSGALSSLGNFYSKSGSGFFTGQSITIQNPTGIPSEFWTHLFIIEKTGKGRGVLFDSMSSGAVFSGYSIGVNDANRLYFESYDQNGPYSKTSSLILGKKNLLAVSKTNNILSVYCYDFHNDETLSETFSINGQFVLPSNKAVIGRALPDSPAFTEKTAFSGYIDEYVIIQDALSPASFKLLVSGLCSDYSYVPPIVTSFTNTEITGYTTGITGVTGVTGYSNVVTGSGLDPFTNQYEDLYGTIELTGYLSSGNATIPLTGSVTYYETGDASSLLTLRTGFFKEFVMDEVSFIRKVTTGDGFMFRLYDDSIRMNQEAIYDFVEGKFQLDQNYNDSGIQVYLNGIAQVSLGYTVTGDIYGSGVTLSGDYAIQDFYLESTGSFVDSDVLLFDVISGQKTQTIIVNTGSKSGLNESLYLVGSGDLVFFNGVQIFRGIDFSTGAGGQFYWASDDFSGVSGTLARFTASPRYELTGTLPSGVIAFPRKTTQLFFNGQRQFLGQNYVENSTIDLIEQSGIFDDTLNNVYNNEENFFE